MVIFCVQAYCLIQKHADTVVWWLLIWSSSVIPKCFKIMCFLITGASKSTRPSSSLQLLGQEIFFLSKNWRSQQTYDFELQDFKGKGWRQAGRQNKTEMPGGFNSSLGEHCVSEPTTLIFLLCKSLELLLIIGSPRVILSRGQHWSAAFQRKRERCQFSTDVKWHCFIGLNSSSAIL